MDRLSAIFNHFLPTARVFYSGNACRRVIFDEADGVGHIHILHSGCLQLSDDRGNSRVIDQPSVLFYPRPQSHAFIACDRDGPTLLCASIDLGNSLSNPLADALPGLVVIPLEELNGIGALLNVMFAEAFDDHCGRQVALDHLVSYFLILLIRHLIDTGNYSIGLLAGLSDVKLSRALTAVHENPSGLWSLERLADIAGMSRARFAAHFRQIVGMTVMDYVSQWRMGVAQSLLKQGYSIKQVAPKVGYQSAAALTRTFTQKVGMPPRDWISSNQVEENADTMNIGLDDYLPTT